MSDPFLPASRSTMRSLFACISLVMITSSCALMPSEVEIWNKSGVTATHLRIAVGGNRLSVATIAPDGVASVNFEVHEETSLTIDFELPGPAGRRSCSGNVYVAGGLYNHLLVILNPDGGCSIQSVP